MAKTVQLVATCAVITPTDAGVPRKKVSPLMNVTPLPGKLLRI